MSAFKQTADFKIPLLSVRETEAHAERALVETGLARIETLTIAGKEPAYNLRY